MGDTMTARTPYAFIRGRLGDAYSFCLSLRNRFRPPPPLDPLVGGKEIFDFIAKSEIETLLNRAQFYEGRNHWGGPALAHIRKNGKFVGWAGRTIAFGEDAIPCLQPETDFRNWEKVFREFRPSRIVDCGTAYGGSTVLFQEIGRKLGLDLRILTLDIDGSLFERYSRFHKAFGTLDKASRLVASSTSPEARKAVAEFLAGGPGGPTLFHFDDLHTGQHVLEEMEAYKEHLRTSRDLYVVGDTWDHGLISQRGQKGGSPYSAVVRFLNANPEFAIDYAFHRVLEMPCNFIEGVIRRP